MRAASSSSWRRASVLGALLASALVRAASPNTPGAAGSSAPGPPSILFILSESLDGRLLRPGSPAAT